MTIVGEEFTDIKLDENGQPVADIDGDFSMVSGDACWKQDLWLEAHTEESELFYEDEDGDEAYGFGMLDFTHAENDEFTAMEIQQRIRGKLAKRIYLDPAKTVQKITCRDGVYYADVTVSKQDSDDEYNMELSTDEVEVEME